MDQFILSALLQFYQGVDYEFDSDNEACGYWRRLESMGLIQQRGYWFSATDAGLRIITMCESSANEAYQLLRLGGLAK